MLIFLETHKGFTKHSLNQLFKLFTLCIHWELSYNKQNSVKQHCHAYRYRKRIAVILKNIWYHNKWKRNCNDHNFIYHRFFSVNPFIFILQWCKKCRWQKRKQFKSQDYYNWIKALKIFYYQHKHNICRQRKQQTINILARMKSAGIFSQYLKNQEKNQVFKKHSHAKSDKQSAYDAYGWLDNICHAVLIQSFFIIFYQATAYKIVYYPFGKTVYHFIHLKSFISSGSSGWWI